MTEMQRIDPSSRARRERGQILPLFAGGLVALLLVGSLVVDLGFIFMTKRQEQNAADPGALAAARYIQPTADVAKMWDAACFYALENDFKATRTDTNATCDPGGANDGSTVTVHYPPSAAAGEFAGKANYVEVTVGRNYRSFLAGIIGMTNIPVSSNAVAANDNGSGGSSSLVALSNQGCGGGATAKVNGGGSGGGIYIFPATGVTAPGGYIQVNSTCGTAYASDNQCMNDPQGAFEVSGSNTIVQAPALYVQGACTYSGNTAPQITTVDEGASYVGDPLSLVGPPKPGAAATCPTGPSGTAASPRACSVQQSDGLVTFSPGTYYGGWSISNGATITLNPGIYIIAGGGISQTGGTLDSATGRVLIFGTDDPNFAAACKAGSGTLLQCQQDIDVQGNGTISLRGLDGNTPCAPYGTTGCPYGGMLLWQDATASGAFNGRADIFAGGKVSTYLEGTIYSAGGDVTIIGSGSTTGCTADASGDTNCASIQIIAWTFQIGGSAILNMPYDPNKFYHLYLKGLVR